ncbi:MAG: hypothetical protein QOK10_214 [Pseudonocardiales bacterium]|jgi:hypothetical protein|nr:hypothetical protein [Pseudonocardiales bacterium]
MPFWTSEQNHSYPPNVTLEVISPTLFRLLTPFTYMPLDGSAPVDVLAYDPRTQVGVTDLASVPPLLWGLLPSYGRQLRAALLHDQLCAAADVLKLEDRKQSYLDRRRADGLFLMAMRDPGDRSPAEASARVPWARSWIFWTAVSFGRYWGWRKFRALLMSVQVVAGVALSYLAIPGFPRGPLVHWLPWKLGTHWYGFLLALAVLFAACVLWWRDWLVAFIGLIVAPVMLPVLTVTFVASRLLGVPDWFASKVPGACEPDPNWGPRLKKR